MTKKRKGTLSTGGLNTRWDKYIKCWNYYMEGGKMRKKRKDGR
jgi:hypothetical protein